MYTSTLRNTKTNNELKKVENYNFREGDLTCRICKRVHTISEFGISYLVSYINKLNYWRCYPQGPRPILNCINCYSKNTQVFYTCVKCSQQKPLKNFPKAKQLENDNIPCLYCIRVSKGKYANKLCYKTPNYEGSNCSSPFNVSGRIGQQSDVTEDNFIKNSIQSGFERTPVVDIFGLNLSGVEPLKVKRLDSERSNSPSLINSGSLNQHPGPTLDSLNICSNSNSKNSDVQNLLDSSSINQQPDSAHDKLTIDPDPKRFGTQNLSNADPLSQQPDSKCKSLTHRHNSMDDSTTSLSKSNFINQKSDSTSSNLILSADFKNSRTQTFRNSGSLNQQSDSKHDYPIAPSDFKSTKTPYPLSSDISEQQSNSEHDNFIIVSDKTCIYNTTETQLQEQIQPEILSQPAENLGIPPFNFNIYSLLQLIGRKNSPLLTKYPKPSSLTEEYYDERNSSEMDMEDDYRFLDLNLQPVDLFYSQHTIQGPSFQYPNIENNVGKTTGPNQYNMYSEQKHANLGTSSVTAKNTKRNLTNFEANSVSGSNNLNVDNTSNNIKRIRTDIESNSATSSNQTEPVDINDGIQQNLINIEHNSTTTGDIAGDAIVHDSIEVDFITASNQLEVDSVSEAIEEDHTSFEVNKISSNKINDAIDISKSIGQIHDEIEDNSTTISNQLNDTNISSNTKIDNTETKPISTSTRNQFEGTAIASDTQQNSTESKVNSNISNQQYLANIETNPTDIINQLKDSGINKSNQEYSDNNEANSTTNDSQLGATSTNGINGIQQNTSNNDISSTSSINQIESNSISNVIVGSCTNADTNPSAISNSANKVINSDRSEANITKDNTQPNNTIYDNGPEFEEDLANCTSETKGSSTTSKFINISQMNPTVHNSQSIIQTSNNNLESNPLLIPPLGAQLTNGLQPLITVDECRNKVFGMCQVFENPNTSSTEAQQNSIIDNLSKEVRKEKFITNDIVTQEKANLSTESLNSALITPTKLVTKTPTPTPTPSNIGNNQI